MFELRRPGKYCYIGEYIYIYNLLEGTVDTIKKNTETLIDASKEVGLEVNAEKTKYCIC
jgi:hypothetical protein